MQVDDQQEVTTDKGDDTASSSSSHSSQDDENPDKIYCRNCKQESPISILFCRTCGTEYVRPDLAPAERQQMLMAMIEDARSITSLKWRTTGTRGPITAVAEDGKTARRHLKRAMKLGFRSIQERFKGDKKFRDAMGL